MATERRVRAQKLQPAERERLILEKSTAYFARHGFNGNTRELARELGITQSLLYRYFPNKQALIERVYEEVYVSPWRSEWEALIRDRSLSLHERLHRYYSEYSQIVLQNEWVRLLVLAGLHHEGIYDRFFETLRARILVPVVRECVAEFTPRAEAGFSADGYGIETELVWGLHASIFYIGMRRWIYHTYLPDDTGATVHALVQSFLEGMRARLRLRT